MEFWSTAVVAQDMCRWSTEQSGRYHKIENMRCENTNYLKFIEKHATGAWLTASDTLNGLMLMSTNPAQSHLCTDSAQELTAVWDSKENIALIVVRKVITALLDTNRKYKLLRFDSAVLEMSFDIPGTLCQNKSLKMFSARSFWRRYFAFYNWKSFYHFSIMNWH